MSVSVSAISHEIVVRSKYGVRPVSLEIEPSPNWSSENGRLVLRAMGLETEDLCGEATIAEARRGVMLGLNRKTVPTRAERNGMGERGCKFFVPALEELDVRRRIQDFSRFVEVAAAKGATHIMWC